MTKQSKQPAAAKADAKKADASVAKGKKQQQQQQQKQKKEEQLANVEHPYLNFLAKRIRSSKKKLEKIKALEVSRAEEGKVR